MVATLNNGGGFYRREFYIHEARMHGGNILPPCIQHSQALSVIQGCDIYLGFAFLQSLESKTINKCLQEREKNGLFFSLDNFIDRVPISMEQISILIKINAFRFTKRNKRELLWEAHMKIHKISFEEETLLLFKAEKKHYKTPNLPNTSLENAFDELELLGYPLCNPFSLLTNPPEGSLRAKHLIHFEHKLVKINGYLVTTKNTATANGKRMFFGTFLDEDGNFIDTVHFPPIAAKYPFRGKGVYQIIGKVLIEFDCTNIEVSEMKRLAIIEDPRYAEGAVQTRIHGKRYKNTVEI